MIKISRIWGSKRTGGGCLTHQTLRAFVATCIGLVNLSKYALGKLGMNYVLLGKVQTDNLEKRFSEYRQLCGGNYNVTVQSVLEAEKKLRLSSLLSLSSSTFGTASISIKDILASIKDYSSFEVMDSIPEYFMSICDEVLVSSFACDEQSLVYLAGCGVHKCQVSIICPVCVAIVKMDKDMLLSDNIILDLSYIQSLDRGGLKYPTYLSVMYAYRVYCVVQLLLSQRYMNASFCIQSDRKLW